MFGASAALSLSVAEDELENRRSAAPATAVGFEPGIVPPTRRQIS